jgi:hypothetical protein
MGGGVPSQAVWTAEFGNQRKYNKNELKKPKTNDKTIPNYQHELKHY